MIDLHLVGLGALGYQMAVEIAKRAAATEKYIRLILYDFDQVEERNTFSQNFSPADVGQFKAEVAGRAASGYPCVEVLVRPWKITPERIADMELTPKCVIIDAVDNLKTRHLLWNLGMNGTPVLHMGMSYHGTGSVSWNCGEYDKFPLSPDNLSAEAMMEFLQEQDGEKAATEEVKLPPCDLNTSRALGLNTVHSALDALWILMGRDSANVLPTELDGLRQTPGIMTNWNTSVLGRELQLQARDDIGVCEVWQS